MSLRVMLVLGVCLHANPADAGIINYDAVTDFSLTTNSETSDWSYRFSSDLNRDGSYSLFASVNSIADPFPTKPSVWNDDGDGAPAYLGVNLTGATQMSGSSARRFTWNANEMMLHPRVGGLTILSWLSPLEGTATIDYSFTDAISFGDINWFVQQNNDSNPLNSGSLSGGTTNSLQVVTNVLAGDRVNFIVDPSGSIDGDAVVLSASISLDAAAVPEPSSFVLLSVILGVGFLRYRGRPSIL